jgi:SAM-dependent methyltransferase
MTEDEHRDGGRIAGAWGTVPPPVRRRITALVDRAPAPVRRRVAELSGRAAPRRARWGNLRRRRPFSKEFGFDRGQPVDRYYIEQFLARHAADVRGACIEVLNDDYTRRFGGAAVTRADILDADPGNARATIVADLSVPDCLPEAAYDCFILTQTIHYLPDPAVGVANAWRALRPGGVLLLTLPAAQRYVAWNGQVVDRWRLSPGGLREIVERVTGQTADVRGYGNLTTTIASFLALAAEELRFDELERHDPEYPIVSVCRVVRGT